MPAAPRAAVMLLLVASYGHAARAWSASAGMRLAGMKMGARIGGLRGGGNTAIGQCPICTKAHQLSVVCRAGKVAGERSSKGRIMPTLATARGLSASASGSAAGGDNGEANRRDRNDYSIPKGTTAYGWGSSGYDESASGKAWGGKFTVLGIETSCDDTAAAVVSSDGTILGESKRSQDEISQEWGGVVPGLARDAHKGAIDEVIEEALSNAGIKAGELDAVACTMGPGLEICLRVGFHAARDVVSLAGNKPFVSVHHLEAHVLTARQFSPGLEFPFLVLLVSGGHCQLLVAKDVGRYEMIGGTLDDSLGEAYDKAARMLGLEVGGGGGPALEALAKEGDPLAVKFGVPMRQRRDCNFSFAGLKTAVRLAITKAGGDLTSPLEDRGRAADIAASFQHVAVTHLEERLKRACGLCFEDEEIKDNLKKIVVCGGVAANQEVRRRLTLAAEKQGLEAVYPPPRLCTDNGVMVAWAAVERLRQGATDDPTDMDVRARWPLGTAYPIKEGGGMKKTSTKHTRLASSAAASPSDGAAASPSDGAAASPSEGAASP